MKNLLIILTFFTVFVQSKAQVFTINDQEKFIFEINVDPTKASSVFNNGTIRVYLKHRHFKLLEVESEQMTINPFEIKHDKGVISYFGQGVVVHEDFNFDGNKDLALQLDYSSKGPVYTIYLYNGSTFVYDSSYTHIIQNSQGNYDLEPNTKEIFTRSSGGCCYSSAITYKIIDGIPFMMYHYIQESNGPFYTETERTWREDHFEKTVTRTIDRKDEDIRPILSFKLQGKDKTVLIHDVYKTRLYYTLVQNDDLIEFSFPEEITENNRDFDVDYANNKIYFSNKDAKYEVYQTILDGKTTAIGVVVTINNKKHNLKGDLSTLKGNIKDIPYLVLDNVYEN